MTLMHRFAIGLLGAGTAFLPGLGGCSATPRFPGQAPADFTLSVCLQGTPSPGWFVLDPDGTLRGAEGERLVTSPVPPIVRTLTDAQRESVYESLVRSGIPGDPALPVVSDGPSDVPGAVVFYGAGGGRRCVLVTDTSRLEPIVTNLRGLCWADGR